TVPLPEVVPYGLFGATGVPVASVLKDACATEGWLRSVAVYVAFALKVCCGRIRKASQPVSSVVKTFTPGPVSWNWTQPLQPVKSFGAMLSTVTPPGRTSLNMIGVLTSTW